MISYGWVIFIGLSCLWLGYMYGDYRGFCNKLDARNQIRNRDAAYERIDKRAHQRYLARVRLKEKE